MNTLLLLSIALGVFVFTTIVLAIKYTIANERRKLQVDINNQLKIDIEDYQLELSNRDTKSYMDRNDLSNTINPMFELIKEKLTDSPLVKPPQQQMVSMEKIEDLIFVPIKRIYATNSYSTATSLTNIEMILDSAYDELKEL